MLIQEGELDREYEISVEISELKTVITDVINKDDLGKEFCKFAKQTTLRGFDFHEVHAVNATDNLLDAVKEMAKLNHRVVPVYSDHCAYCGCGKYLGGLELRNILRNCWKHDMDGIPVFKIYQRELIQEKHLSSLPILTIDSTIFEAIEILQECHLVLICKNKNKTAADRPEKCIGVLSQNSLLKYVMKKFELSQLLKCFPLSDFHNGRFMYFYLEDPAMQVFLAMSKYKLSSMPIVDVDGYFQAHVSTDDIFYFLIHDIPSAENVTIATYLNLVNAKLSLQSQSSFLLDQDVSTLADAVEKLLKLGSHHLWAIKNEKPIACCSISDVYRTLNNLFV